MALILEPRDKPCLLPKCLCTNNFMFTGNIFSNPKDVSFLCCTDVIGRSLKWSTGLWQTFLQVPLTIRKRSTSYLNYEKVNAELKHEIGNTAPTLTLTLRSHFFPLPSPSTFSYLHISKIIDQALVARIGYKWNTVCWLWTFCRYIQWKHLALAVETFPALTRNRTSSTKDIANAN